MRTSGPQKETHAGKGCFYNKPYISAYITEKNKIPKKHRQQMSRKISKLTQHTTPIAQFHFSCSSHFLLLSLQQPRGSTKKPPRHGKNHQEVTRTQPRHIQDTTKTQPRHHQDTTSTQPRQDRDTTETSPRHHQDTTKTQPRHHQDCTKITPRHNQNTTEKSPRDN